jgi:hypothetical protein
VTPAPAPLAAAPAAEPASAAELPEIDLSQPAAALEVLDRPARVYHLSDEGFSLTMVVHESIDV